MPGPQAKKLQGSKTKKEQKQFYIPPYVCSCPLNFFWSSNQPIISGLTMMTLVLIASKQANVISHKNTKRTIRNGYWMDITQH